MGLHYNMHEKAWGGKQTFEGDVDFQGQILGTQHIEGKNWYVNPTTGDNGYRGEKPDKAKAGLSEAEELLSNNRYDTLWYNAGGTSLGITTTITWDKNYTRFIGLGAPARVAQRSRIFNTDNTGNSPLMTVSANGCVFANMYLFQGSSAADTRCVDVTGDRNYFFNVHFAGIGHATAAADIPATSLKLTGSENFFEDCTIGIDTIKRTAANSHLLCDGAATRNYFRNCRFVSWSETAAHAMVIVTDTTALDRTLTFEKCLFYNFWTNHVDKCTEVFTVPASAQTHDIILMDCMAVGYDEWESNDRGQIWSNMTVATAEDGGIAVEPINT